MTYVIVCKSDGAVVGTIETDKILTAQEAVGVMFSRYGVEPDPAAWGLFEVRKEEDQ